MPKRGDSKRRRRIPESKPDKPEVIAKAKRIAAHLGSADLRRLRNWASDRAEKVATKERMALALRRLDELAAKPQGPEGDRLMLDPMIHLTSRIYQPGEAVVFQVKRGRKYRGLWITNDRLKRHVRRNRGWVWVTLLEVPDFVDYEPNPQEARVEENLERGRALAGLLSGPGLMSASDE